MNFSSLLQLQYWQCRHFIKVWIFFVTWIAHNDDPEGGLCCNGHSYALGLCFAAVYNDIVILDFC